MPLHLLPKKSWNVYSPANIARVKADEAAATALEEEHDERLRDYEASKRLALLRGEQPPTPPPEEAPRLERKREREPKDLGERKRRRRAGEDDTERDIRYAREDEEAKHRKIEREGERRQEKRQTGDVAPLTDHKGHIQLFAAPSTKQIRADKNAEAEREKKENKERDGEDGQGMRFKDAAGRGRKQGQMPWYASGRTYTGTDEPQGDAEVGRNAFGREDPGRGARDQARIDRSDPMAAMAKAQVQFKQVARRREQAENERLRELEALKEEQGREERRAKRPPKHHDDELEGFSLDDKRDHHQRSHREHKGRGADRDGRREHRSDGHRHHGRSRPLNV